MGGGRALSRLGEATDGLDHVAFRTADLDAAAARFDEEGFTRTPFATCTWPHQHGPHEARCFSVVFEERRYFDVLETGEAALEVSGVVLRTDDLASCRRALTEGGIASGDPYQIWRRFPPAAGESDQHYAIFGVAPGATAGVSTAVIQTTTPIPLLGGGPHPNGARRLDGFAAANGGIRTLHLSGDVTTERSLGPCRVVLREL